MITPELFNFKPALPRLHVEDSLEGDKTREPSFSIQRHFLNHSVAILLPDILDVPEEMEELLSKDTEYYKLTSLPVYHFVLSTFIQEFVKKGEVTGISIGRQLDVDDCAAVTPTGVLALSMTRETFFKLGIEQGPAVTTQKIGNFMRMNIDLKNLSFVPGKKNYERVLERLKLCQEFTMDFVMSWEPDDASVCPSSLALYFFKHDVDVSTCSLQHSSHTSYTVQFPPLSADEDLHEWVGAFALSLDFSKNDVMSEFLGSFESLEDSEEVGRVILHQWRGLITRRRVAALSEMIRKLTEAHHTLLKNYWNGMVVHGFQDSPVSWELGPHGFEFHGDNFYTALFGKNGRAVSFRVCQKCKLG